MHNNRAFVIEGEENYKKFLETAKEHTSDTLLQKYNKYHKKNNCKKLEVSYEIFKEENIKVLSVIDTEKDEVLNMFYDEEADEMFRKLTEVEGE